MAVGIRFYRNREKELFKNSEETEDFTLMINNLFDALNRKYSAEGIRNGSKDFEVFNLKQNFVLHVLLFSMFKLLYHVCFIFGKQFVSYVGSWFHFWKTICIILYFRKKICVKYVF